jgi:hypothetical protein
MKLICSIVVLTLLSASCKDWLKEPEQPVFAVVICDASNSATKFSHNQKAYFDSMVSKIHALPDNLPSGSVLFYIPVTWNEYKDALGGRPFEKKSVNDAQASDLRKSQQLLLDTICNQLHQLASTDASSSCILTSIRNAYSIIESNKTKAVYLQHRYQIIILSDMMEYCNSNSVGWINMEIDDPKTIKTNLAAISLFNPGIDLNRPAIDLRVVLLTPGITGKQSDLLKSYWRKLFQKMNYDSAKLRFDSPTGIKKNE